MVESNNAEERRARIDRHLEQQRNTAEPQRFTPTTGSSPSSRLPRDTVKNARIDAGHFHAVRFYDTRESLCRIVADFLGEAWMAQQPALVIATPEHRAGILGELRARHVDVNGMQAAGDLFLLYASETLATFMVDGMPDASLFFANMAPVIQQVSRGRKDCTIRAYAEMVDVLWKAGQDVAAIRLEMLWNKLAMTHDFSLLCGYAMGSFYKDASLREIHHQHTHVVSAEGLVARTHRTPIS